MTGTGTGTSAGDHSPEPASRAQAGIPPETAFAPGGGDPAAASVFDRIQFQVAIFARRMEQIRIAGAADGRPTMDRAAFLMLNRLAWMGPVGVKALAKEMGIDSSTVTRQVAPLVEGGLVERVPNPADGRAVLLELSEDGHRALEETRSIREERMRQILADWPEEERETFCALLTRFNISMRAYRSATLGSDSGSGPGAGPTG